MQYIIKALRTTYSKEIEAYEGICDLIDMLEEPYGGFVTDDYHNLLGVLFDIDTLLTDCNRPINKDNIPKGVVMSDDKKVKLTKSQKEFIDISAISSKWGLSMGKTSSVVVEVLRAQGCSNEEIQEFIDGIYGGGDE